MNSEPTEPRPRQGSLLDYVDRNPVSAVIQALALGLAVGIIIRLIEGASSHEKKTTVDIGHKPTLDEAKYHLGSLVLPFLWPAWQKAQEGYDKSAGTVRETVDKLKKADLPAKGRKHLKKAEHWASGEATQLAGLGKATAKDVEKWVEDEILPAAECGWKRIRHLFS